MNKKLKIGITIIALCIGLTFVGTKTYATTGKTTNDTTRIRKEASTDSKIVAELSDNQEVEIISEDGNWYQVKYKSYEGYIRKDLLKVDETKKEDNNDKTTEEDQKGTEQKTITDEDIVEKTEIQLKNDTELQLLPLVYSSKTGKIAKDTKTTVIEVVGGWCHLEAEEQEGWIMTSKLVDGQNTTVEESKTEKKEDEEKKEDTKTGETKKEETKTENTTTKLYVSTDTLNLREKTNKSSRVLTQLSKNDEVTVIEKVDDTWSKVKANGVTGYVATQYLSKEKVIDTSSRNSEGRTSTTTQNTTKENTTSNNTTSNNTTNSSATSNKTTTNSSATNNTTSTTKTNSSTTSNKTAESSKNTTTTEKKTETETSTKSKVTGSDIVAYAKKFLGYKYVYGTAGPKTFDCSGFTSYVYKHFGYSLNRTSSGQRSNGKAVKKADLQPGDIVCFSGHVGIYIGDGKFIHAANSRKGVIISSLSESYYKKKYITARRIID